MDTRSEITETNPTSPAASAEDEKAECSLCFEPMGSPCPKEVVAIELCGHSFHTECMGKAISAQYARGRQPLSPSQDAQVAAIAFTCPLCRGRVTNPDFCEGIKLLTAIIGREPEEKLLTFVQDIQYVSDNICDPNKNTLLHLAASEDYAKLVEALLKRGASPKAQNTQFWTPLHCAADAGAVKSMRLLLDAQADKDAPNNWNWTPLHLAAQSNRTEAMALLFAHKANANAEANIGRDEKDHRITPLHVAVYGGHEEATALLLQNGANPNVQALCGLTPLHVAAFLGNENFLESVRPPEKQALLIAKKADRAKCVQRLLDGGADGAIKTAFGQTYPELRSTIAWDDRLASLFDQLKP